MIATCPRCSNTGYLGDRFCSCTFAATLRDRIETAPEFAEFRRKRAEIDYMLAKISDGDAKMAEARERVERNVAAAELGARRAARPARSASPTTAR